LLDACVAKFRALVLLNNENIFPIAIKADYSIALARKSKGQMMDTNITVFYKPSKGIL